MVAVWVWLGGTAAYLILAGQVGVDEVAAGIVLGGLGAAWHAAACRCSRHRFTFERHAGLEVLQANRGFAGRDLEGRIAVGHGPRARHRRPDRRAAVPSRAP